MRNRENRRLIEARQCWAALDCPNIATIIAAAAYALFIIARLDAHAWQPSAFVTAGDRICDAARTPASLRLLWNSHGYDGQYYYRMAVQPFDTRLPDVGVPIDIPAYRYQRVLYPLLSWVLAAGRIDLIPWTMIAVNYAAVCCLAAAAARFAQGVGRHAFWGLAFAFYPGLMLSLARDLTECLPAALVMWALVQLRRGHRGRAGALLCGAVLARETTVLVALAMLLDLREAKAQRRWAAALAPLLTFAAWKAAVTIWWATVVPVRLSSSLSAPGFGLLGAFVAAVSPTGGDRLKYVELWYVVAWAALGACRFRRTRAPARERAAFLLTGALALSLAPPMWIEDWGFLRLLSEFYMFALVIIVQAPYRLAAAIVFAWSLGLSLHLAFLKCF